MCFCVFLCFYTDACVFALHSPFVCLWVPFKRWKPLRLAVNMTHRKWNEVTVSRAGRWNFSTLMTLKCHSTWAGRTVLNTKPKMLPLLNGFSSLCMTPDTKRHRGDKKCSNRRLCLLSPTSPADLMGLHLRNGENSLNPWLASFITSDALFWRGAGREERETEERKREERLQNDRVRRTQREGETKWRWRMTI